MQQIWTALLNLLAVITSYSTRQLAEVYKRRAAGGDDDSGGGGGGEERLAMAQVRSYNQRDDTCVE